MEQQKIERINALAKKAKEEGLTPQELEEQKALRQEYVAAYKKNLEHTLKNIVVQDEQGNQTKLKKKGS